MLSNNLHEIHGYNRLASIARGDVRARERPYAAISFSRAFARAALLMRRSRVAPILASPFSAIAISHFLAPDSLSLACASLHSHR